MKGDIMKNEMVTLDMFSKDKAVEIAESLNNMDAETAKKSLTSIIHELESMTLKNEIYTVKIEDVNSFLKIISKSIQRESKQKNSWKFYLYGKYDSRQATLFNQLQMKIKKEQRAKILSKKNVPRVLQYLYSHGASRHGVIAKSLGLDRSNLLRLMEMLSEEGLVDRMKIPSANITCYELTREGYQICTSYYRKKAIMEENDRRYTYSEIPTMKKDLKYKVVYIDDYTDIQSSVQSTSYNDTKIYFLRADNKKYETWKKNLEKKEQSVEVIRDPIKRRGSFAGKTIDYIRITTQHIGGEDNV